MAASKGTCSVSGCDRAIRAKGYCAAHHERVKATGSPGSAEVRRYQPSPLACVVVGCGKKPTRRGFCQMHYGRWRRKGDPGRAGPERGARSDISYTGVHSRLRDQRGRAGDYLCHHCDGPTRDWAYNHSSLLEQYDPESGRPYTMDLNAYIPLCSTCHRCFDARVALRRQVQ